MQSPHPSHFCLLILANDEIKPITVSGIALFGQISTHAPHPTQFFKTSFTSFDISVMKHASYETI
jgi:hypothetical protein